MATTASARAKRDFRSMIERFTAWYWLALHTAMVQRAKGTCGDSPRRLPRDPGFDYSAGSADTDPDD
jgi:hypothetical protein